MKAAAWAGADNGISPSGAARWSGAGPTECQPEVTRITALWLNIGVGRAAVSGLS
jgi:hypothetical protein